MLSDLLSGFDAVHNRHAKVHEYCFVGALISICLLYFVYSFLTIDANVEFVIDVNALFEKKLPHHCLAKFFVVHYKISVLLEFLAANWFVLVKLEEF